MPLDRMPDGFDIHNWPPDRIEYSPLGGDIFAVDPTGVHTGGNMLDHYLTEMGHQDAIWRDMQARQAAAYAAGSVAHQELSFGEMPEMTAEVQRPAHDQAGRARWLNELGTRPFGALVTEEFGDEAAAALPAEVRERQPVATPPVTAPRDAAEMRQRWREVPNLNVIRGHQNCYSHHLAFAVWQPGEVAARYGLPVELATTPDDAQFCRDFLAVMAQLGFPDSLALPPALLNPNKRTDLSAEYMAEQLLTFTEPVAYEDLADKRWSAYATHGHNQQYQTFIEALTRRAAAGGEAELPKDLIIRGYPLRPLNERAMLYLCEDGGLPVYAGRGWLPAPVPVTKSTTWPLDKDPAHIKADHRIAARNQHMAYGGNLQGLEHFFRSTDAYPPKERLLDIAGRALGVTCQTDRLHWHTDPRSRRAHERSVLSRRWAE